jgi:hypothetical protein
MIRVRGLTKALTAVLPLLLGGCSSMLHPHNTRVSANNDIPAASTLDVKRSQTLFLTIVSGLRDQGQSRAALAYLDEFERQYPRIPYAALLRAQCLMDVGKAEEAEPIFNTILKGEYAAAAHAGLGSIAASRETGLTRQEVFARRPGLHRRRRNMPTIWASPRSSWVITAAVSPCWDVRRSWPPIIALSATT